MVREGSSAIENHAVQVSGLTRSFGDRTAVDNLSFTLPYGSVTGFVGPNGAGKTTTIRMLLGLVRPSSGTGSVLGKPIEDPRSFLGAVGAMIESPAQYGALSGRANLQLLQRLGRIDPDRVDQALELVGLTDRAGDRAAEYSLGMKQRLGIAAALLPDPELLVLDEPTNGLDPSGIREIRALLRGLAASGTSVFVSSHLLSEIESICDRLVMIRDGRLVYEGSIEGLLGSRERILRVVPELPEDLDELSGLLMRSGLQNEIQDRAILVDATPAKSASINRLAMENGIVLIELGPRELTLEDAFFELEKSGVSS